MSDKAKWIDDNLEELKNEFNINICKITGELYGNPENIANPVLSRNTSSSKIFEYFCDFKYDGKLPTSIPRLSIIKKLIIYYLKSIMHFTFLLIHFFIYKLSYKKSKPPKEQNIILIDTFTMIDRIYPARQFKDNYFGNLYTELDKLDLNYAVLGILFGDKIYNLKKRYLTYKYLEEDDRIFLSEFEFLKLIDYIKLFYFAMIYPFRHIGTKQPDNNDFNHIFNVTIDETVGLVQTDSYVRYLFAKRLRNYFEGEIKVISWYENQVIHKLLFRGLGEGNILTKIYGTEFTSPMQNWIQTEALDCEKKFNVLPDKIISKGKHFQKKDSRLEYVLGYAPRESYLFDVTINKTVNAPQILGVLLGYEIDESQRLVEVLKSIDISNFQVIIRVHPNHKLNSPFDLPTDWILNEGSIVDFANSCQRVVSVGTGAAFEVMFMECFVCLQGGLNKATTNPLPKILKGKNWDIFYSRDDLLKLLNNDSLDGLKLNVYDFFEPETEENIIKSLELA